MRRGSEKGLEGDSAKGESIKLGDWELSLPGEFESDAPGGKRIGARKH